MYYHVKKSLEPWFTKAKFTAKYFCSAEHICEANDLLVL